MVVAQTDKVLGQHPLVAPRIYIEIKMTGEGNTQRKRKNAQANNITTTKVDVLPNISCTPASSYANFTLDV